MKEPLLSIQPEECIATSKSLQDFFRGELTRAVEDHHVSIGEETLWYLTQLLYNYRRSDAFFDYHAEGGTLTPLTEYYRAAVDATTKHERRLYLQRLGDVSIFISSLFAGALSRKPVNVGYYISMGASAYGSLADTSGSSSRDRGLCSIFTELAEQFSKLVPVISDVKNSGDKQQSLLAEVQEWEKTRSPVLRKKLESKGVILYLNSERKH